MRRTVGGSEIIFKNAENNSNIPEKKSRMIRKMNPGLMLIRLFPDNATIVKTFSDLWQ
jgi:hypothetical protein